MKHIFAHLSFLLLIISAARKKSINQKNEAAKTKAHYDVRTNPQKFPSDVTMAVAKEFLFGFQWTPCKLLFVVGCQGNV